jgi:hypothetical protein
MQKKAMAGVAEIPQRLRENFNRPSGTDSIFFAFSQRWKRWAIIGLPLRGGVVVLA